LNKIDSIDEHMIGCRELEIEFIVQGHWYHPSEAKKAKKDSKVPYTEEDVRTVNRLATGELKESDIINKVPPFWVEHGKAWQGLEGPGGLTGQAKGQGFTKTTKVTKGGLGMTARALSASRSPSATRTQSARSSR